MTDQADAAQQILALERRIFEAIKTKDTQVLEEIVSEDFVFRGPWQPEVGKPEFLKSIEAFPIEITEIWSDDMKVNVYDDIALLTGVQQARTLDENGKEVLSAGAFSDLFVRRTGKWLLVLAYNVEIIVPPQAEL